MRMFKISKSHGNGKPFPKGLTKKQIRKKKMARKSAMKEGVLKARLDRSGLWNPSAQSKCTLKVYRVGEEPPLT